MRKILSALFVLTVTTAYAQFDDSFSSFVYVEEETTTDTVDYASKDDIVKEENDKNTAPEIETEKVEPVELSSIKQEESEFQWYDEIYEDLENILKHNVRSYPIKEDYWYIDNKPQFRFHKGDYHRYWFLYNNSEELIAVPQEAIGMLHFYNDIIIMLIKYDYEHNAYNINSESLTLRKTVEYYLKHNDYPLIKYPPSKSEIKNSLDQLNFYMRNGKISRTQYNKLMQKAKKNISIYDEMREKCVEQEKANERAQDYIEQLRKDNEEKNSTFNSYKCIRIDGFNFRLEYDNGAIIQATYNQSNEVEWNYKLLKYPDKITAQEQKKNQDLEEDNRVSDVVEQMPSYPGGQAGLLNYLNNNMKYPVSAYENGVQGRVIVQFVIGKDGSISNVQVAKSVDPLLDKEAVRIVKAMPKWIPGKQNGKVVKVRYTLPVTFCLQ